jgi:hypothetical protein
MKQIMIAVGIIALLLATILICNMMFFSPTSRVSSILTLKTTLDKSSYSVVDFQDVEPGRDVDISAKLILNEKIELSKSLFKDCGENCKVDFFIDRQPSQKFYVEPSMLGDATRVRCIQHTSVGLKNPESYLSLCIANDDQKTLYMRYFSP